MKLSEKILYYRKRDGLSQEALAAKVGVSRQAVSKWEVGDATPELDKLVALAKTFGVTTDELLGMEESVRAERDPRGTEQPTAQTLPVSEDLKYVLRNYGRFTRWYSPILIGLLMLVVGIYVCITEWHIYEMVPYMWQASQLPFCVSAAMAALGAGEVIWGVVRLVRHRRKEINGENQAKKS